MLGTSLHLQGATPTLSSSTHPAAARFVRCSRSRQTCVRPVNFKEDGADAQQAQGTDLAAKKAATKVAVFSSGAPVRHWQQVLAWGQMRIHVCATVRHLKICALQHHWMGVTSPFCGR